MSNRNCHDAALRDIAKSFLNLSPFPDASPERGAERLAGGDTLKHVSLFPNSQLLGVRYYIAGRDRFFAYAKPNQIDDAIRFADACTLSFWKYRQRGAKIPDPGQFNISIEAAEADLEDWKESAPEILKIIQDIETHLLEVEVFIPPKETRAAQVVNAVHSKAARRTLRGELRSVGTAMRDALLDIAAVHEKNLKEVVATLNGLCKRMDVIETQKITWGTIGVGGPLEYSQLIMAVARVFPGETRHQTALRYIQEAERGMVDGDPLKDDRITELQVLRQTVPAKELLEALDDDPQRAGLATYLGWDVEKIRRECEKAGSSPTADMPPGGTDIT